MKKNEFNHFGISGKPDIPRIKRLLAIGIFASLLHLAGDLILGWGVEDETRTGVARMLSAYTGTSDGGILAAALLGLFGMSLEGLSFFGIYRLIAARSAKFAHRYRTGIFGYLMFGACGFHVPTCALVFLSKHGLAEELVLRYAAYFLLPAFVLFWIFFLIHSVTQIRVFAKGLTPCSKWAWVFSMPVGMALAMVPSFFANVPLTNALACGWIAFGSLWMFAGLRILTGRVQEEA